MTRAATAEPAPQTDPRNRQVIAWRLAVVAVTAAVGAHGLAGPPFWRDEVASVEVAGRPLGDLVATLATTDVVHGTYYLLLHLWMQVGSSEAWVRTPSLLAAVAAVLVTAELARRRMGILSGTAVAALLVANPYFMYYAAEARSYALVAAAVSGAAFALHARSTPRWALAAGLSVVAVYLNLFAFIAVAGLFAGCWIATPTRALARRVGAALAGVVLLASPLIVLAAGQTGISSWIPVPDTRTVAAAVVRPVGSVPVAVAVYLVVAVAAVLVVVESRRRRSERLPASADCWSRLRSVRSPRTPCSSSPAWC